MKLNIAVGCSKNKIFLYGNVFEMKKVADHAHPKYLGAPALYVFISI
jgi:hypothetical protein